MYNPPPPPPLPLSLPSLPSLPLPLPLLVLPLPPGEYRPPLHITAQSIQEQIWTQHAEDWGGGEGVDEHSRVSAISSYVYCAHISGTPSSLSP